MLFNAQSRPHLLVSPWQPKEVLWMDEFLHHWETMVETIVGWYLQGNRIIPGFLRWCRISSIHSISYRHRPVLNIAEAAGAFLCGAVRVPSGRAHMMYQGSSKDTFCNHLKHVVCSTPKLKGNHHLQGNVRVYNVRIPVYICSRPPICLAGCLLLIVLVGLLLFDHVCGSGCCW